MMNRITTTSTIFLCLSVFSGAFGQGKFALSVNLAPVYSQANFSAYLPNPNINPANPGFSTKFNAYRLEYSLGLMARYSFSPMWSVSTGIWASHPFAGRDRFTDGISSVSGSYKYDRPFDHQYKAPLMVNYRTSSKRISPYISVGTTFDFRKNTYVEIDGNGNEVRVKFGKAVIVTPLLGIGAIIDLKKNLSAVIQPTFQYDLQSQEVFRKSHVYRLSLQTQLMYRF